MDIAQVDSLFFTDQIVNDRACLTLEEMRHAITVLRKRIGDELALTDGQGMLYMGRIAEIGKKETWLDIISSSKQKSQSFQLNVAIAPTKSFDRMEWCIEKLTEMGVQTIIPLLCERSEREKWKQERVRKVLISAIKQSKRAYLPSCTEPMKFPEAIKYSPSSTTKYIALQGDKSVSAVKHYKPGSDVFILIGPEGDFTEQEVKMAGSVGFMPLSLGEYRLRTETAAVVAAATIHALNQK